MDEHPIQVTISTESGFATFFVGDESAKINSEFDADLLSECEAVLLDLAFAIRARVKELSTQ